MRRQGIPPIADRAWQDLSSTGGRLGFGHDVYLKLWQLSRPKLACDFVLLDEAQDADPAVADVVARQHDAQRVLVGGGWCWRSTDSLDERQRAAIIRRTQARWRRSARG